MLEEVGGSLLGVVLLSGVDSLGVVLLGVVLLSGVAVLSGIDWVVEVSLVTLSTVLELEGTGTLLELGTTEDSTVGAT